MNNPEEKTTTELNVSVESPKTETATTPPLTQEQKDANFRKAIAAYEKLLKMRKKKHRGQNSGAFGGAGTKRKAKKKLARYLERNTVL